MASNLTPSSTFEITRRDPSINASAIFTPTSGVASRGIALGQKATDPTAFDYAQSNNFIGFLTRRVTPTGLSIEDRVFGVTSDVPVGVEAPFTSGFEVTVEKAKEIECEGEFLNSGVGAIATGTTVPQNLSLNNGTWRIAQGGDNVNGYLTANNLTPFITGNLRVRIEVVG